jgi:hypothetical protein
VIHECRGYTTGTYNQAVELRPRAITNDMGQGAKAGEPGTWEPGAFSGRTRQAKWQTATTRTFSQAGLQI